jgi:hypothetical protein
MKTNKLVIIPFYGFYESIHSQDIDDAVESIFYDYDTDTVYNAYDNAWEYVKYTRVYHEYAKLYAQKFAFEYDLQLTFESLNSPKEYNFTTDRIYCYISQKEILRLYSYVRKTNQQVLTDVCKRQFTSRSGFSSFYSPFWQEWGYVIKWDANQLSALLEAYLSIKHNWDDEQENDITYKIAETISTNNSLSDLILAESPELQAYITESETPKRRKTDNDGCNRRASDSATNLANYAQLTLI